MRLPPSPRPPSPGRRRPLLRLLRMLPLAGLAAGLLGIVDAARAAPAPRPVMGWTWTLTPAPDLSRLDVHMCFEGLRPLRLRLSQPAGAAALLSEPAEPGRFGLEAQPDGWVPTLAGGRDPGAACLAYQVDLEALLAVRAAQCERIGRDLLVSPAAFLLVPALWPPSADVRVEWVLPAGLRVSVPWDPLPAGERGASTGPRHRLGPTSLVGNTVIALGRFAPFELTAGGTRLEVAVLDQPLRASIPGLTRWLSAAADAVAALYGGRLPVPQVQVLVEPVRPGGDPVPFGQARQSGGASLHLLLSAAARDDDLPGEWVAVHESVHLCMPWIDNADAWFSEGVVTYYQEVLRARAGFQDERALWQALDEGFARGRRRSSGRTLAEESRLMLQHHAFHRVYWGGAAIALLLDLEIRRQSGGARSLDDLMRLLSDGAFTARLGWRGLELLKAAEDRLGLRGLADVAARALRSTEFPDLEPAYARLGIAPGAASLSPDPSATALRAAIGAPPRGAAAR